MSILNRAASLRYGVHSSTSDFTSTPGTLYFVRPRTEVLIEPGSIYEQIPRPYQTDDNEDLPALRGRQDTSMPDLDLVVNGLSGSGAGNGTNTSSLSSVTAPIIGVLAGGTLVEGLGDTFGASPGSGTSFTMDGTASNTGGSGVLILGNTSGKYSARTVTSAGGSLGVDRALTDDTGSADTPSPSSVCYGGRMYPVDNNAGNNPIHLYLDAETYGVDRYQYFGVYPSSAMITAPSGGAVGLSIGGLRCTSWTSAAGASPSYSAPTTGNEIVVTDCPLHIGSTLYMAYDYEFDFGLQVDLRRSDGGTNGHFGSFVRKRSPSLKFKLRRGAFTAPAEYTRALMETAQGSYPYSTTTYDVMVQLGRLPTACMAIRIPAARLKFTPGDDNGQAIYNVEAISSKSSASSSAYAAMITIF